MNHITLYKQDRFRYVSELSQEHNSYLADVLLDTFRVLDEDTRKTAFEAAMASRIVDLEESVIIHYVDKSRDLSAVQPIPKAAYFTDNTREVFQPLLDALAKGDFALAERLAPEGCRLCGYQELPEPKTVEEYGHGWAGQFCITEVPGGIYPVFAKAFAFHEAKGLYTNHLQYFPGLQTWLEGTCVRSSNEQAEHPFPNVVCSSPYAYSVAKNILEGKGDIRLIYPFQAQEISFQYDGKQMISHQIIDTRLPALLLENPLRLRMDVPLENTKSVLAEKIENVEQQKPSFHNPEKQQRDAPER